MPVPKCTTAICGMEPNAILTALFIAGVGVEIYFVIVKLMQRKFAKKVALALFLVLFLIFWMVFKITGYLVFGDVPEVIKLRTVVKETTKTERVMTGAVAEEIEGYRARQSAAGCPNVPAKYSGLVWLSDKFKQDPAQGWFLTKDGGKVQMFEGEADKIYINSSWTEKTIYPAEFVNYYNSQMKAMGWVELETHTDEYLDTFKFVKSGRYFNFGVVKHPGSPQFEAYTEIAHCYPKPRQKYTLSLELDNPEDVGYLLIYTQNLWESTDRYRLGYDPNYGTLVKRVAVTGKVSRVILESGVYKIIGSGKGVYGIEGTESINLDQDKTMKLGVSSAITN